MRMEALSSCRSTDRVLDVPVEAPGWGRGLSEWSAEEERFRQDVARRARAVIGELLQQADRAEAETLRLRVEAARVQKWLARRTPILPEARRPWG